MQKKSEDFSMQEALRLSKTPAGQQLLSKLQQADQAQLKKIADQAAAGDYTNAAQQLSALLKQLGE
ncbi:MAG: hypothetical protein IJO45_03085 [Oscillospiraceae bacterium]|nr:hypothetical protein [Oscillospiraceae bacterium]